VGGRLSGYVSVVVLALAFGWIEASVVVYLRELYAQEIGLETARDLQRLEPILVSLPQHLLTVEVVREACTLLLLGAVGWLAGRRFRDKAGAFFLAFGLWDLMYYAVLRLILGWPESLRTWDVLFLIPLPWVAPVWAPVTIAVLFVVAGSYVFWTWERERHLRWTDVVAPTVSAAIIIASFLAERGAAIDRRAPVEFPTWLYWAGVSLSVAWFIRRER
jgi:hypothetical protein